MVTGTILSGTIAEGDALALVPPSPARGRAAGPQRPGARQGGAARLGRPAHRGEPPGRGGRRDLPRPGARPPGRGAPHLHPRRGARCCSQAAPRPIRHRSRLLLHVGTAQVPCAVALVDGAGRARPGRHRARPAAPRRAGGGAARPALHPARLPHHRGARQDGGRRPGPRRPAAQAAARAPGERWRSCASSPAATPTPASPWCSRWRGRPASAPTRWWGAPRSPRAAVQAALERLGARGQALLFDRDRRGWVAGPVAGRAPGAAARRAPPPSTPPSRSPPASGARSCAAASRPVTDPRLFQRLLAQLAEKGQLVLEGDLVRLHGHVAASGGTGGALKDRIADAPPGRGAHPAPHGRPPRPRRRLRRRRGARC